MQNFRSSEDPDVDAIDFEAALKAALQSRHAGESMETTMAAVDRHLSGEVPFCPLELRLGGGSLASAWLSEMQAKLATHEAVTMEGWEVRRDGTRSLFCGAGTNLENLPPWLAELAQRLCTVFGGNTPNACELHALEPGHFLPARKRIEHDSANSLANCACVSLTGCGLLRCWRGEEETLVRLPPGSCMLLQGEAARELKVDVSAEERHILLIFRGCDTTSSLFSLTRDQGGGPSHEVEEDEENEEGMRALG